MSDEAELLRRAAAIAAHSAEQAGALLEAGASAHAASPRFHFEAGRVLEDANAPHLALAFYENALALKPDATTLERLFACHFRLGHNRDAARLVLTALETGYRTALRPDFAIALRGAPVGTFKPSALATLAAEFASDIVVGPGLLPHLIAAGRAADIEAIAGSGALDPRHWDEGVVLETAAFLEERGRQELALRILCRCGGESKAFLQRLNTMLDRHSVDELKSVVLPMLDVMEGRYSTLVFAEPYLEIGERFARIPDVDATLDTLGRMKDAMDPAAAAPFYGRYRARIASLVEFISASERDETLDRLALFVAFWIDPSAKRFFSGPGLDGAIAFLAALAKKPDHSPRTIMLRAKYFDHHIKRREKEGLPEAASDLQLSLFALRYFRSQSRHVPADAIPIPEDMAERLRKHAMSLSAGKSVDVLMTYALAGGAPESIESKQSAEDEYIWRYIGAAVAENNIPSYLIADWIFEDLNSVEVRHKLPGLDVTKFLRLTRDESEIYRDCYDPASPTDSILLFLDLMGTLFFKHPQYHPFIAAAVPANGTRERAFLERCLFALTGDRTKGAAFLDGLLGNTASTAPVVSASDKQHVLLIGYAAKGTGLGRNVRMLHEAFAGMAADGVAVELLDVDVRGLEFMGRVRNWRARAGARPIVIGAINAEDIPLALLKDVAGAFDDAYLIGLFLWEMSHAPPAQDLGIQIVDEIWAPTRYVADIYGPRKRTHVVGKGLYDGSIAARSPAVARPFRFLTVFDFDSSIERKNPLAVVQAFKTAFASRNDVELLVKGSGIKPDHWSNGLRHWERLNTAIAGDRRIRLISKRISEEEMEQLFRTTGCMVSLHRGEGFGYVIADAMALGVPVIATDYSGNTDYCTRENSFPVSYSLIPVDRRVAHWETSGAEWADPDVASAAAQMREVVERPEEARRIAARGRETVLRQYDKDTFRRTLMERINAIRSAR